MELRRLLLLCVALAVAGFGRPLHSGPARSPAPLPVTDTVVPLVSTPALAKESPLAPPTPALESATAEGRAVTYPAPDGVRASEDWEVRANGLPVFVHARVVGWEANDVTICGRGILHLGHVPVPTVIVPGQVFPAMFALTRCHGLRVEGITLLDAAVWTVVLKECSNVRISNIKIVNGRYYSTDGFTHELFNIPGECKAGGTIRGVTFRNISAPDWPFPPSEIKGLDEKHVVEDVTFTNLRIQGQRIRDAGAAGLLLRHARNVRFDP